MSEIRRDGFHIDAEIKLPYHANEKTVTSSSIGHCIILISEALNKLRPDFVAVYADRYEGFAAVIAASQMNIPTVHIEGGDLTEGGALDDTVRHAMTKLSHIHFTTNQFATNRILAMGEESWRVHTVGFPGIDLIAEGRFASPAEISEKFELNLNLPIIICTQHSISTEYESSADQIKQTLQALEQVAKEGAQIIITYPNNDAGSASIIDEILKLDSKSIPGIQVHRSLGGYYYHGLLALARNHELKVVCIGNSSSGIKETPAFGCPTINIGSRQRGRLRSSNVIDVEHSCVSIVAAINKCLQDNEFRAECGSCSNPYGIGKAGEKMVSVLESIDIDKRLIQKKMIFPENIVLESKCDS